jgi:DNA-binding PadR family transcriptional regulator
MDLVADFIRGAVQLHVMHHACLEEIHGAAMIEELARHGHRLSPGTLYPMLHRLESAGLLASRQVNVDGRNRRLYSATGEGVQAFRECQAALRELTGEVLK